MMELLSPAGSRESLVAAVQNGADAVYFGGGAFNARRFAGNFQGEEMAAAVDYCHLRGVKTYITLNTLLLDKELEDALSYAAELYRLEVDAVIVQDLGLMGILKNQLPGLTLHASTQMGIHDTEGVRAAAALGAKRVVLSREVPLKEIKWIHDHTDIELEAFAHGALCMSFSGGCLFSSMAGERSGNRGTCAQPCRKRISLFGPPKEEEYALSLSDISMLGHLADMEAAGIGCIKLEGRMKRPQYVAAVTRAYRAALDGADEKTLVELEKQICAVFHRGARTGYFYGDDGVTNCVSYASPDKAALDALERTYGDEHKKRRLDMELSLEESGSRLRLASQEANCELSGPVPQLAFKPQDPARYAAQLQKLGDTVFSPGECAVNMAGNLFLPVSAINELRRAGCGELGKQFCPRRTLDEAPRVPAAESCAFAGPIQLTVKVRTKAQAMAALEAGADEILFDPLEYTLSALEDMQACRLKRPLLLALPPVILSREEHERVYGLLRSGLVDGAEANNLAQLSMIADLPLRLTGAHLNVMNAHTAGELTRLGAQRVTLSLELTKPQLRDIINTTRAVVCLYGRTPLMLLKHCPAKEYKGCANCQGSPGALTDEAGRVFPLINTRQADGCLVRMLNCDPTDVTDLAEQLPKPAGYLLCFFQEEADAVKNRTLAALAVRAGQTASRLPDTTRGHWNRAVE